MRQQQAGKGSRCSACAGRQQQGRQAAAGRQAGKVRLQGSKSFARSFTKIVEGDVEAPYVVCIGSLKTETAKGFLPGEPIYTIEHYRMMDQIPVGV